MMLQDLPPPDPPAAMIVVTARALPDPAADRAFSVEAIDRRKLLNNPHTQLDEVLKGVPGLQLFRRSDSRSGHPTSQGITLRALGGNASSRALLVLDGVPQADPFGGWINWPAYDPATLADVRVIRGGGSVGYGPGALAGVIDMTSSLEEGLLAGLEAGSREAIEGRAHLATGLGNGIASLSLRAARGDGFVPITRRTRGPADRRSPYRQASVRSHWIGPVGGNLELQASASGFVDRRERGLDFTANRSKGADASLRLVGKGRWQFAMLGYVQWREFRSSFASVDADRTVAERVALQDSVPASALGGSLELRPPMPEGVELRLGTDLRRSEGESRELFAFTAGDPSRRRAAGGRSLTAGMFGELSADIGRLTLSGGTRLDYWRIADGELREWNIATGLPLRDDQFAVRTGWRPTARLGLVGDMGSGWSLRSAAYLGWRLPTLNELLRPFRAGLDATAANAELNPERLAGIEAGATYQQEGMRISVTAFANRLKGAIANVTLGEGPGQFPGVGFVPAGGEFRQRQNLDAVVARGIEASAEATFGSLAARIGASWIGAEVDGDGPAAQLDGLRPAQTPRLTLVSSIEWQVGRRSAVLTVRHSGSQFEDDLNQRKLSSATTVDAFVAWPVMERLDLLFRGENLLDKLVVAGLGADGAIERASPRTLWLGLRFEGIRK